MKKILCVLLVLSTLVTKSTTAQVKDSTVTTIYTDFKNFWTTSIKTNSTIYPDTSHNLLAFTFRGKTYSTGVDDATLATKLGNNNYSAQVYKSLPVSNIAGKTSGGDNTLTFALKDDGDSAKAAYQSPYPIIHIADVLTDGKNGLDLGTGVTNLPQGAHISFPVKNLSTKMITDSVPDFVFTQIAQPTTNQPDTIFFYDANNNVVGNKKLVYWNAVSKLGTYKLDLYSLTPNMACNTSIMNGLFEQNGTRDIRMVAFLITEFGITNPALAAQVKGLQINPCGSSDQAFIAYNTNIIHFDVPIILTQPATQTFCSATATSSVTFSVKAFSTTGITYQWKKNGADIVGATSPSYTATGLGYADTASAYSVTVTNSVGAITSDNAYVKYLITSQPSSQYLAVGSSASFTVSTSGAKSYQWQKANIKISGATAANYTKSSVTLADAGSYTVLVGYAGGSCTSDAALLTVENLPSITAQPTTQVLCSSSVSTATFSVTAASKSSPAYQWYKNGAAIAGATNSSYTATGITLADTASAFTVGVTNAVGTTTSSSASVKYIIVAQPTPLTQYLATGNATSFAVKTSGATAWQWQKNNVNVAGATALTYSLPVINYADSGNYTLLVSYHGGTCTSNAAILKTSVVLYCKSTGNLNLASTWGVATDGSGSSPVDFTRDEHTFIVANRTTAATGGNLTIAGKLDVANNKVTITPGTTLTAGRIIRSLSTGVIAGSSSSNLALTGISNPAYTGASDLYFDIISDTLKNLTTASHTVTLHTALNLTAGAAPGVLQVTSGTFITSDSLTLKSDVNGTASIASSAGTITGKVTIERFIHARRAWRLLGAPVSAVGAPSIHAAWQEGAVSSTDNPHPGYGTHITYGQVSDGFDQNPQKTFSMKAINSNNAWAGVPATNATAVSAYPAYLIFIRGNRSYNITGTTSSTAPMTTILRVKGNINQGSLAAKTVAAKGLTLVQNPYACPVNFTKIVSTSTNLKSRFRVWDATLAGPEGTGAWVIVDGSSGTYRATPPSPNATTILQAGDGFFVESNDGVKSGSLVINENSKDLTGSTINGDRMGDNLTPDTSLEINLKLINADSSASIADGVLFNFNSSFADSVDYNDALKINNFGENLGIREGSYVLTIDDRTLPREGDSVKLTFSGAKTASYELEFVPSSLGNQAFYLYDKYLNSVSPISATDTTLISFSVNTSVAASKAIDRFTLVLNRSKIKSGVLPVTIINVKATAKNKQTKVAWQVENEEGTAYYEVQKSTNGVSFMAAGNVTATGAANYSFTDAAPSTGVTYYRIKSVSKTGTAYYSNIVTAQIQATAGNASVVSVYPSPLRGATFTLTLSNMAGGAYSLAVVNENGAALFNKNITHNGGTASQVINLPNTLPAGVYFVKLTSATGKTSVIKISAL